MTRKKLARYTRKNKGSSYLRQLAQMRLQRKRKETKK